MPSIKVKKKGVKMREESEEEERLFEDDIDDLDLDFEN